MRRAICPAVLVIGLVLHFTISRAETPEPRNPGSAKECAICHYRWIDVFFIEGKGSDLVPYQSQKVVATPEMCFSCHDGSVVDSRERLDNDRGHKTNRPPPSHVKVPEVFPLDEDGNVQCATCHTAHGVPSGTEETIFMRTSNRDSRMCGMCHPDMQGGLDFGNHPIGVAEQGIPQKLINRGAAEGAKKRQIICETCHIAHGSPYESLLVESGMTSGLCLACHGDKDIFGPDRKRRPFHVINVKPRKVEIPERLGQRGAKVGHNGVIICQTCHKVHRNKIEKQLLLIVKDNKSTLCMTCHSDKGYLAGSKHDLIVSKPKEKNQQGKTAAQDGVCSACHLPHKPARKLSGDKDFTTQLCLSCHGKGSMAEKPSLMGSTHPVAVSLLEKGVADRVDVEMRKLSLPLFDKLGVHDKRGEMTCLTCHDPHRWSARSSTGEVTFNVKGNRATLFLRKESPEICSECHNKKFHIAESSHDLSKVAPKEKNILGQTFSESGLCGTCHLMHNAREGFLWARELDTKTDHLSKGFCISCHQENGIAKEKLIKKHSHPMNISPFEKGLTTTLPLFDKFGKKGKDGVMSCSTCHDSHRPDSAGTLASVNDSETRLGNRFLRSENSPSPKLCANCHAGEAYVEKTDHDLTITAPFSMNVTGQKPIESGPCGVCHLVHNSRNEIILWAQGFGGGKDLIEMMCTSCHSETGPVSSKKIHHLQTKQAGPVDWSCGACHNVHQWDPEDKTKGNGADVEGDGTNSFLIERRDSLPCADCHGRDELETAIWPEN
jgi:predicted CXXCH cytochrome family protein